MIFRQMFEPESSTYTYLLACPETRETVLIDPVIESVDRDLAMLQELGLTLGYTLETHVHADHVTGAARLRSLTGSKAACPRSDDIDGADIQVTELDPLSCGGVKLQPIHTPGHTDNHHCYLVSTSEGARLFTGDCLLIDGCGRTDFQGGDSIALYRSVHDKLFSLPGETLVYPGHDYQGRQVTSIGQEKARNPRLGGGKSVEEFVWIMAALDLPRPKKIDIAVRANLRCGEGA
jgi:glyoxylase-like metal-dependent hydrolase (beta-lactamase superfamily II)